jgi:hypothetical protein
VADGAGDPVRIPADSADRTALFFISSRTRMMVKRAAVGAEGFVLDHYDRSAIDAHLNYRRRKAAGRAGQDAALCRFQRQPGSGTLRLDA